MEKESKSTNILEEFPSLELMHPAHLRYMHRPPISSLEYLFGLIDSMDSEKRKHILSWAYAAMNFKAPYGDDTYNEFKSKIISLKANVFDLFLINSIINYTLTQMFMIADRTYTSEAISNHENMIIFAEKIKSGELNPKDYGFECAKEELEERCDNIIASEKKMIEDLPESYEKNYESYVYFCDNVVSKLFDESPSSALKS